MLKNKIKTFLTNQLLDDLVSKCTEKSYSEVSKKVIKDISDITKHSVDIIEIKTPTKTHCIKGVTHEKFETVLKFVNEDLPIYLYGPPGTGKNVICKQVAESLSLPFYFTNAVTQEYKLTGFIDANGTYHETQFYKAFKDGGIFFLDELDASIPEVLIILNAAIANRYFDFPIGKIEASKDFRIIAAGNTLGTGADSVYTGRYCLDGASLDRFSVIDIPYSNKIESCVTNGNKELLDFCHAYRRAVKESEISSIFSYRALSAFTRLENDLSLDSIFKMCLLKGMREDDLAVIKAKITNYAKSRNKYLNTFLNL